MHAHLAYPLLAALLLWPLSARQRNEPLLMLFERKQFFKLRIIENACLALPFTLFMVFEGYGWWSFLPLLFGVLLAMILWRNGSTHVLTTPFGAQAPEFIKGFRKSRWVLLLLYSLVGIGIAVGNLNLAVVSMVAIGLLAASYFTTPDDSFFVWQHRHHAASFLRHKIKHAVRYGLALLLLPWLVVLCSAPQQWPLLFAVLCLVPLYLALAVLGRYLLFPHDSSLAQALLLGLCMVLPFFLPIVLPYCFIKARQRLQMLLT